MDSSARGTFEVQLTPQPLAQPDADPGLGRMAIAKQFTGDMAGEAAGEMLTALTSVEGSAGYVAIERFTGTLHGRAGSFVLQHSGAMAQGEQRLAITIVPDSGSGELAGIAGTMSLDLSGGAHAYDLTYSLPE